MPPRPHDSASSSPQDEDSQVPDAQMGARDVDSRRHGAVVFAADEDGSLRVTGRVPDSFATRFPALCAPGLDLSDTFPFLENFLIDAEDFWVSRSARSLNSGPWIQEDRGGIPIELEATATWDGPVRVLLMEFLGSEYREVRGILQSARDQSLALDSLEKFQVALQGSEERMRTIAEERRQALELLEAGRLKLESRVRARTEELHQSNHELQRANAQLVEKQEQLRLLAEQLSIVEVRERRRIATYLHDNVGQGLALLKLKLGLMSREVDSPYIAEISELVASIVADTRTMTFELGTPALYELGLEAALETLATKVTKTSGLPIRCLDDSQPKETSHHVRSVLYQSVGELLHNIVKHAEAESVEIRSARVGGLVQIEVQDDGRGFASDSLEFRVTEAGGFGLFNIRERLQHLGGKLQITSQPGIGTRAVICGPLEGGDSRAQENAP